MAVFGVPAERKAGESRCLTPEVVAKLIQDGHIAIVEDSAGYGAGFSNEDYEKAGAKINDSLMVWSMRNIIKVKEPQPPEFVCILPNTNILCFAHWSGNLRLKEYFDQRKKDNVSVIPYEELIIGGKSPVLREMSLCAGELAAFAGLRYLTKEFGGKGILPSEATVQILGAGNVGWRAMEVLHGCVKKIHIHDARWDNEEIHEIYRDFYRLHRFGKATTHNAMPATIAKLAKESDIIICSALQTFQEPKLHFKAPKLITRKLLAELRDVVIVDVVIDEGGNCEASLPRIPEDPVLRFPNKVILYSVPNMPGTVSRSSSRRFSDAVYPFAKALLKLSDSGKKNISPQDITATMGK